MVEDKFLFETGKLEFLSSEGKKAKRRIKTVAYDGGVLTQHGYWDAVIFDLSSIEIADKTPVLINHDREKNAGFINSHSLDNGKITIDATLLSNKHGKRVAADADEGFNWQASVHIVPQSITRLEIGQTEFVNGIEVSYPTKIFRNNIIREVSLTPTGVDEKTKTEAFSLDGEKEMTDKTAEFTAKIKDQDAEITALKAGKTGLEAELLAAKDALKAVKFSARESEIVALAKVTKVEFSKEDTEQYHAMTDEMFATVSKSMSAIKPAAPDNLFEAQATGGGNGGKETSMADRVDEIYKGDK